MDSTSWKTVWVILMNDPIPLVTVAIIIIGIVWYLRGFFSNEQIAALKARNETLEERLRLASDQADDVNRQIESITATILKLGDKIDKIASPTKEGGEQVAGIAATVSEVRQTVNQLSTANQALSTTLDIAGGRYGTLPPNPASFSTTKKSAE